MTQIAARSILDGELEASPDLQDLARVAISLIHRSVEPEFKEKDARDEAEYFHQASTIEGDSIVAIVGPRGSGKTTLLSTICRMLLSGEQEIVLPIVRPESFRSTDSLISVFVGHLRELIAITVARIDGDSVFAQAKEASRTEIDGASPDNRIAQRARKEVSLLLQKVSRSAALSAPRTIEILGRQADSLSQYALDAVGLIRYSDELVPSLRSLVAATRDLMGRSRTCTIIVPLDDADLVPHRTSEILSDLRTISALPNVVPIICVDSDDLHSHLEADLRRDYGQGIRDNHITNLARQQISKTIKPSNAIAPPYFRHERRMRFSPLGESTTLNELLRDILRALDSSEGASQSVIDWITQAKPPSLLNRVTGSAWLPDNPRALENLWRVSKELKRALDERSAWSVGPMLSRWLDVIVATSIVNLRTDVETVDFTDETLSVDAAVDVEPDVHLQIVSSGPWQTVVDTALLRIRARRFSRVALAVLAETRDKDSSPKPRDLGPEAASSFLLVQDVLRLGAFNRPRPQPPQDIDERDFFYLQSVEMLGQETDDLFFSLPRSAGAVQIERARSIWNSLIESSNAPHGDEQEHLSAFAKLYITLTIFSWLRGTDVREVSVMEVPTLGLLIEMAGRRYLEKIDNSDISSEDDLLDESRAYIKWFEVTLPCVFHQLIFGGTELEEGISSWLRFLSIGNRSTAGIDELRSFLRERSEKNVTPANRAGNDGLWMCGYIPLLENIDSELRRTLESLEPEYQKRRSRGALGKRPTSDSVALGESESYSYSEVPSAEGVAERELISSVLAQLRR